MKNLDLILSDTYLRSEGRGWVEMLGYVLDMCVQIVFIHWISFPFPDVRPQEWFSNVEKISKEKAHILHQLMFKRWHWKATLLFQKSSSMRACGEEARLRSSHSFNRKNLEFR